VQLRLRYVGLGVSTRALVELGLVSKPILRRSEPSRGRGRRRERGRFGGGRIALTTDPIALPTRAFFDSTGCMRGLTAVEIKG